MRIYGMVAGIVHPCNQPVAMKESSKRCCSYGLTKPARSFAKRGGGKLGSMCRDCKRAYDRERRRRRDEARSAAMSDNDLKDWMERVM